MMKFLQDMTDMIFLEDAPQKADVIFLPGSEEGALAVTAARLYKEGYAPLVVPSGKYAKWTGHSMVGNFKTESDHFAYLLEQGGVPKEAILKEREATYTYQNAIFTKQLLDKRGITVKRAILCCQAYHARRSKLYYQVLFPETEILVCPTITKGISKENWCQTEEGIRIVLGEIERCGTQFHEIVKSYGIQQITD